MNSKTYSIELTPTKFDTEELNYSSTFNHTGFYYNTSDDGQSVVVYNGDPSSGFQPILLEGAEQFVTAECKPSKVSMDYLHRFLLANNFEYNEKQGKYWIVNNEKFPGLLSVTIINESYFEVEFLDEDSVMHSTSLNIYWLVGVLAYYGFIGKVNRVE